MRAFEIEMQVGDAVIVGEQQQVVSQRVMLASKPWTVCGRSNVTCFDLDIVSAMQRRQEKCISLTGPLQLQCQLSPTRRTLTEALNHR